MATILIIEDEHDLQQVLEYNLRAAGHEPLQALRGEEGLRLLREHQPALVLLDLMLPDMPGTEVCKAIRRDPACRDVAVIMLTARGEEIDRVVGFELGADDYVIKPFSVRELLLRIQAVLRRKSAPQRATSEASPRPSEPPSEGRIDFGCLRLDVAAHRVWVEGREVELTAMEFRLLHTFYLRRNRVQSRAALLDEVWKIEADIETRTVDTHVKRLREKLGPAGRYIETVRGVGYRFVDNPTEA